MEKSRREPLPGAMEMGVPIEKNAFRALVTDYLGRMESAAPMATDDYVTMTRLWNTIEFRRLGPTDPLFQRYAAAFFPGYVERISKSLDAQPTKGMALYSKKYDLFIGGRPHAGSQFKLED